MNHNSAHHFEGHQTRVAITTLINVAYFGHFDDLPSTLQRLQHVSELFPKESEQLQLITFQQGDIWLQRE